MFQPGDHKHNNCCVQMCVARPNRKQETREKIESVKVKECADYKRKLRTKRCGFNCASVERLNRKPIVNGYISIDSQHFCFFIMKDRYVIHLPISTRIWIFLLLHELA